LWLIHYARHDAQAIRLKAFMAGRKDERFKTELPLKFEGGTGVVRNVSASGIYFVTDAALQEGQPVEFTLEFENFPSSPIAVNCIARIVRVEQQGARTGVAAAISSFEFHRVARPGKGSS
jgi:hypothetical protein